MPRFIFLGRQCRVGSDDFYFPALFACICRSVLIIASTLYIAEFRSCSTMQLNTSGSGFWFSNGTIILNLVFVIIESCIVHISSKGSIANSELRVLLQPALVFRSILTLLELGYGSFGLYLADAEIQCLRDTIFVTLMSAVMLADVVGSFIFGWCILAETSGNPYRRRLSSIGDPYGNISETQSLIDGPHSYGPQDDEVFNDTDSINSIQLRHWETRCQRFFAFAQCLTCNLFGGAGTRHDSMSVVAEVMAQLFYGDPDLVLSDIVAGFVLLSSVHTYETLKAELAPVEIQVETQDSDHQRLLLDNAIADMSYFSKYAVGIYGWMLFVWSRPWLGMLRLLFTCCRRSRSNIIGDNCLHLHQTAFQLETGISMEAIVYAKFSNSVCQPAYAIALDHAEQTVVISIRGTLSLEDCLTDIIAHGCSMNEAAEEFEFDGHGGYAHQGMLHAALWLRREIEQLRILESIYRGDEPLSIFQQCDLSSCSTYNLLVVGHSLGAGTAALLTMMLRRRFPFVKCYAYSPPACVVSKDHAKASEEFVTSCVIGSDIVARSSLISIQNLRNDVLEMIERSKVSKREILRHVLAWKHPDELLYKADETPNSKFSRELRQYRDMLAKRQEKEYIEPMFTPGKVIHFDREFDDMRDISVCRRCISGAGVCCTNRSDYYPKWSSADQFTKIHISRTMLDDHFPDKMHHVLNDVSKRNK